MQHRPSGASRHLGQTPPPSPPATWPASSPPTAAIISRPENSTTVCRVPWPTLTVPTPPPTSSSSTPRSGRRSRPGSWKRSPGPRGPAGRASRSRPWSAPCATTSTHTLVGLSSGRDGQEEVKRDMEADQKDQSTHRGPKIPQPAPGKTRMLGSMRDTGNRWQPTWTGPRRHWSAPSPEELAQRPADHRCLICGHDFPHVRHSPLPNIQYPIPNTQSPLPPPPHH